MPRRKTVDKEDIGHLHAWAHGYEHKQPTYCWVGTSFLLVLSSGERSVCDMRGAEVQGERLRPYMRVPDEERRQTWHDL